MNTIYIIKLIEDSRYKGGIFYKKSNRFEYPESLDSTIKYYSMTKDNAIVEQKYLSSRGYNCFVDEIVIEDEKGICAYSINTVKKDF